MRVNEKAPFIYTKGLLSWHWTSQSNFFFSLFFFGLIHTTSSPNTNKQKTHSALNRDKKKKLIHLRVPWLAQPAGLCWFNTFRGILTTTSGMLNSQAVDSQSCWRHRGFTEGDTFYCQQLHSCAKLKDIQYDFGVSKYLYHTDVNILGQYSTEYLTTVCNWYYFP